MKNGNQFTVGLKRKNRVGRNHKFTYYYYGSFVYLTWFGPLWISILRFKKTFKGFTVGLHSHVPLYLLLWTFHYFHMRYKSVLYTLMYVICRTEPSIFKYWQFIALSFSLFLYMFIVYIIVICKTEPSIQILTKARSCNNFLLSFLSLCKVFMQIQGIV